MKKSSFVTLILGAVSGVLFALGMCMALLPEWDVFIEGIILGSIGIVLGLITLLIWRKMEGKQPIKLKAKTVVGIVLGVLGSLIFGVGMSLCIIGEDIVLGTLIGLVGFVILLALIPVFKGLK